MSFLYSSTLLRIRAMNIEVWTSTNVLLYLNSFCSDNDLVLMLCLVRAKKNFIQMLKIRTFILNDAPSDFDIYHFAWADYEKAVELARLLPHIIFPQVRFLHFKILLYFDIISILDFVNLQNKTFVGSFDKTWWIPWINIKCLFLFSACSIHLL